MADFYSSYWGNNYSPRIRLSVSIANVNGNTARVTWILDYVTSGYAAYTNGIARAWSINIDGQVRSGTYNINGVASTTRISSGTIDVSRTNTTRNISCSASLNFDVTWNGSYSGTRSASGSIGVEQRVSYTVSFNANGGTGAPGSQTRWYGEVIYLSSTRPTRTGYVFKGWAKSPNGAVEYNPGSAYGLDANTTLYAIWSPETYTISFNANGGSGAPGNQTKTYGQTLTLSSTRPTRTNYNFIGWGSSSGSTTAEYQPGGSYTNNGPATLYAIWELDYTPPRITNIKIDRCNSSGALTENGTYAKVEFTFACDRSVKNMRISSRVTNNGNFADNATFTDSRLSGSISKVVGGSFSVETTYDIQITVSDSAGNSSTIQGLAPMSFVIDFKKGGKGVAIGGPSNNDLFEVYMRTRLTGGLDAPVIPNKSDLNNFKTPGFYRTIIDGDGNQGTKSIANRPTDYAFSLLVEKSRDDGGGSVRQTLSPYNTTETYVRRCYNNSWSIWVKHVDNDTFNGYFDARMNSVFNDKFDSRFNSKLNESRHKLLWSGNIGEGQRITINNFSNYSLIACQPGSDGIFIIGYKTNAVEGTSGQLHCTGGTGTNAWYAASFDFEGNSVRFLYGTAPAKRITKIIGII